MKIVYFILLSFFITSCSAKHYKELSTEKYKNINIPKDYTAIYCSCDKNPLLLKIIQELREVGLKVIIIDDYNKLDKIKSSFKSIVIYGYSKQINGSSKNYTTTKLVSHSESSDCGKGCTVSREWNELVRNTVTSSGNSIHNNVLMYKIDENTELLLALNSGDKYSINLVKEQETGSKENVISESNAYEFVSGTNKVVSTKRDKLEKPIEVEKNEKGILIEYIPQSGLGQGLSIVYYYSDMFGIGFDTLYHKEEETSTSGEYKIIEKEELSTNLIYAKFHPQINTSFYMQFGILNRDWLLERQRKIAIYNRNTTKYVATYGDYTFLFGVGWNWIWDNGFSFTFGLLSMISEPDYEYVEENNYIVTEYGKEYWEKKVEEKGYLRMPAFIKVGWMF